MLLLLKSHRMVGETKELPLTPAVQSALSPMRIYRYRRDPSWNTVVENVEGVADADCFSPSTARHGGRTKRWLGGAQE